MSDNKGKPLDKKSSAAREHSPVSILLRLNAGFFFELVGIFLALDVALGIAAGAVGINFAEHAAQQAANTVAAEGFPDAQAKLWLQADDIAVQPGAQPTGRRVPDSFHWIVPVGSLKGERYIFAPVETRTQWFRWLDDLTWQVAVPGPNPYVISVDLGADVQRGRPVFWTLLIAELFLLLSGLYSRAKKIRRTLRPISELAETARTLNTAGTFTPREMEALAGKINAINASRLDTRIAVSSTQAELKNLAAAINGMLDRINESYRAQVRFVSDASHELRTPIAVIQGYASLLDRWGKNDEKALEESISAIKSEADNMKLLVEQLLFLARGDNNTMILQMERFDAAALAEQVFRETQMIDAAHIYESRIGPAFIEADEALVKQAMRILIDNAIKYTPAGGKITLITQARGNEAEVTVQDEGIGIPADAVPQIFDRFFRADESRARATGGAGLGLSIAQWIAERHGGHMEVLSRENIGTRISVVLPLAGAEEPPEAVRPVPESSNSPKIS